MTIVAIRQVVSLAINMKKSHTMFIIISTTYYHGRRRRARAGVRLLWACPLPYEKFAGAHAYYIDVYYLEPKLSCRDDCRRIINN